VKCNELYEDCPIWMYEHEFLADIYKLNLTDFGDGLISEISGSNRLSKTKDHPKRAQWGKSSTQREGLKVWSKTDNHIKSPQAVRMRKRETLM